MLPVPAGGERLAASEGPGPHLMRYGGRSGRLGEGRQLAHAEPRVEVATLEREPRLLVWLPALRTGPAGTTIFARLEATTGAPEAVSVEIAAWPGLGQPPEGFVAMPRAPAGGQAQYQWRFVPPPAEADLGAGHDTRPPLAIRYLVRARGRLDGAAFQRSAGGVFYLHSPGARLLADSASVERRQGDLVMTAAVKVDRPGSYWAYAELWGGPAGDRPVAFARERLPNLTAGRHEITLLFGGQIIHDSGVDGPYVVRNLRWQQVDTHPPHEDSPTESLPATAAWKASEFH